MQLSQNYFTLLKQTESELNIKLSLHLLDNLPKLNTAEENYIKLKNYLDQNAVRY